MKAYCSKNCGTLIERKDTAFSNPKKWVCINCKKKNMDRHNEKAKSTRIAQRLQAHPGATLPTAHSAFLSSLSRYDRAMLKRLREALLWLADLRQTNPEACVRVLEESQQLRTLFLDALAIASAQTSASHAPTRRRTVLGPYLTKRALHERNLRGE